MNVVDGLAALLGEPLELLLGGAHRGAALLAADAALGEQVLGHQARPRWSWRARPRSRRRAGGCGRSRRGTGRRCRGPRSRAVALGAVRAAMGRPPSHFGRHDASCVPTRPTTSTVPGWIPAVTRGLFASDRRAETAAELPAARTLRDFSGAVLRSGSGVPASGQAHPVEDPGQRERPVVPGACSARRRRRGRPTSRCAAARPAPGGGRPQPGHPLGRLDVEHPGVVEGGLGEDRRVGAGRRRCRTASTPRCSRRPPGRPRGCPTRRTR